MRVTEIPFGSVGIDCLSPISPAVAKEIAAYVLPGTKTGITFVERYLENLTAAELEGLFAADLGVALVGEGRVSGWDAASGAADAERELARARALELPAGSSPLLSIGCDLEAMENCTVADATAYGSAWGQLIVRAAFAPEGYVGDGVPLSPVQLYELPFVHYWRSLSNVQQVAVADFGKFQLFPTQTLRLASGPFAADVNFVCRDKKLRLPSMVLGA
jgi:hypothetical protein